MSWKLVAHAPKAVGAGRARGARGARGVGSRRSSSPAARSPRTTPHDWVLEAYVGRAARPRPTARRWRRCSRGARPKLDSREAARDRLGGRDRRSSPPRSAPAASTSARPTSRADRRRDRPRRSPPREAFGTGQHATTAGCLAMLDAMKRRGAVVRNLADIGTGTGLLAFAACALWPGARAIASDIDEVCETVVVENALLNRRPARHRPRRAGDGHCRGLDDAHPRRPRALRPASSPTSSPARWSRSPATSPTRSRRADTCCSPGCSTTQEPCGARRLPHRRLPPRRADRQRRLVDPVAAPARHLIKRAARVVGWALPAWPRCRAVRARRLDRLLDPAQRRLAGARAGRRDPGRHQRRPHRAGPAAGHAARRTGARCSRRRPRRARPPYTHVAVSWGEREVFLNTPTWWDLTPMTVLRIVGVGGEGLIHAAHYVRPAAVRRLHAR